MKKEKRENPYIDRALDHFQKLEGQSVDVPEWGDESGPLVVFWDPITLAEKSRLYKMAKNDDMALLAHTLIMKAKTEDGEKMFTIEDKHALMHRVDPDVISRVASAILGADADEDSEKN